MFFASSASALYPEMAALPVTAMPYFDVGGELMTFGEGKPFLRARYLEMPVPKGWAKAKPQRYAQPRGSGCRAYFPMCREVNWPEVFADVRHPVAITEGEKKALVCSINALPAIGLGGVANYIHAPTGALIADLASRNWRRRHVYIVFDSDVAANAQVQMAESRLIDELTKLGAIVHVVRLPADGDAKIGLDDYFVQAGAEALKALVMSAPALGGVEAAVMALNRYVALIARDGMVYDREKQHYLQRQFFLAGSEYSAIMVRKITTTGRNPGVKEVPIAPLWLTHPLAQRYADILFRPGDPEVVLNDLGKESLNIWRGWRTQEGDVSPFLRLNEYLFHRLPAEHRDFALRLMIYKAQNPQKKTFAIVLSGDQGGGKNLWAACMAKAFAPFSCSLRSAAFAKEFQGWLEKTCVAVVSETSPEEMRQAAEVVKTLITDEDQRMNEKFRVERDVRCFTTFILAANDRAVGSFARDDRRMFVVPSPPPHPDGEAFYAPIFAWRDAGGPEMLMHWMLNYDLQGWTPGIAPPMTAEKAVARREGMTAAQQYAEDMATATEVMVLMWLDAGYAAALGAQADSNTRVRVAAIDALGAFENLTVRDFYTAAELTAIFPQLVPESRAGVRQPGWLSRELRNAGVRFLECKDSPEGFRWKGVMNQYLVIANRSVWAAPLTQAEFEEEMRKSPRYLDVRVSKGARVR